MKPQISNEYHRHVLIDGGKVESVCECVIRLKMIGKVKNKLHRAKHGIRLLKITSCNVTTSSNVQRLRALEPDIAVVQEVRGPRTELKAQSKEMGLEIAAGKEDDEGLVAVLTRPGLGQAETIRLPDKWKQRVCCCKINLGDKTKCGHIINIYSKVWPNAAEKQELNKVLEEVLTQMAEKGEGPIWIMGDFNLEAGDIAAFDLMARRGWKDWSEEPTCLGSRAKKSRRIDMCWVSPMARARTSEGKVIWQKVCRPMRRNMAPLAARRVEDTNATS